MFKLVFFKGQLWFHVAEGQTEGGTKEGGEGEGGDITGPPSARPGCVRLVGKAVWNETSWL